MKHFFGPESPQDQMQMPQIRLEDLDFSRMTRIVKWLLLVVAAVVVLMGLNWARTFYTDWLWFSGLGHEQVLLRVITAKVWLFLLGVLIFALLAAPNLYAAFRFEARTEPQGNSSLPAKAMEAAKKLLAWVVVGATALAALFLAGRPASEWEMILRFLNGVAFNQTDPIFQKDFSFYVFTLPALGFGRSWLMTVVVLIMAIVAGFYYFAAMLRGERFSFTGKVRAHLVVLGAGLFVLIAAGHWLGRYELLFSPTGAVYGVGYTDDHVTLPVRTLLTVVALVSAGGLVASISSKTNRLILYSVGLWIGLNLLAGSVVPGLVQRLFVEPSELARETPYLASNIKLTRQAYGLEGLQSRSHPALGVLDSQIVAQNQGTVQNVRLWDEGPLLQIYNQIQFFRLYYDFTAVHTDRYTVDGQLRQVMLAGRELASEKLPAEAQRWVNRHLQFTHGFGVAMSPVTEVEADGRPTFLIQDVPPVGKIPLKRPEIYYGQKSLDFLIARSGMQEFNYPGPSGPVYTRYEGKGGVALSSLFRRFLYAWQFMDVNILISGEIKPDSVIQYRRTVQERFSTVTPFLMRDREAYCVVADGRLFWIQDGYTFSDRYPYATPFQRKFNYIRNSVKAVVDAYHGTLDYYVSDPADPLIRTYQAIFPRLFKGMDDLPVFLQEHIRYPLDLFSIQTEMLLQYHMEDPVVFYNKEDQWAIPVQTSFGKTQALKPYYIVARLPGEKKEEFLLIQPFTPNDRHNLVGWIAARNDGKAYGELVLFRFPTGRHVDGPNQVEARIDNDAVISEQFTLWGQVGSEVSRGILLVIPLGDHILYAEPVFLKPETIDFPELRRIILADSRQIAMHRTLDDSIQALVGVLPAIAPAIEVEKKPEEGPAPGLKPESMEALRRGLQEAIDKLQGVLDQLKRMAP
jgi:uncharacterized membrane protein (UPF0182 family)